MNNLNTRPVLLDKEAEEKRIATFRRATVSRAWGSAYDNGQGALLGGATQGTQFESTSTAGKPSASWILDSTGNVLLGIASVIGNSRWGANTSSTHNVNVATDERKSFSFVEVRSLAVAAAVVAVVIALVVVLRHKK